MNLEKIIYRKQGISLEVKYLALIAFMLAEPPDLQDNLAAL